MRRKLFKVIAESKVVNNLIYGLKIAFVVRFLSFSFRFVISEAETRGGGERHWKNGRGGKRRREGNEMDLLTDFDLDWL